ncbi:hypothetical protein EJB05_31681, partial [Eragrostis curvula]
MAPRLVSPPHYRLMPTPAPKPTDPALLLRLCTVLYQHQNASDDALTSRRSALPVLNRHFSASSSSRRSRDSSFPGAPCTST